MFDTDLPLALIMEEILGWEKKPSDKEKKQQAEQENQSASSTSKRA